MRSAVTTAAIASALLGGCVGPPYTNDAPDSDALLIFHNNSGPMCLAALDWLESVRSEHPDLVIEEHLTYEAGESEFLAQLTAQFQTSQGVSTSFQYLPIVFFRGQAFSGFNDDIAAALQGLLLSVASASPGGTEGGQCDGDASSYPCRARRDCIV